MTTSGMDQSRSTGLSGRAPRWIWVALIASLAVNLLVVGLAAGAALHFRHRHDGGPDGGRGVGALLRSVAPERREQIRAMIEQWRPKVRELRNDARAARDEALRQFASDPFNEVAFKAAHDRLVEAETKARAMSLQLLPDIATQLTVEERRRFVEMRQGWLRPPR